MIVKTRASPPKPDWAGNDGEMTRWRFVMHPAMTKVLGAVNTVVTSAGRPNEPVRAAATQVSFILMASRVKQAEPSILGLKRVRLLEGVPTAALDQLAAHCRWRRFPAGQRVISRDAADQDVYLIVSGRVRVTSFSAAGRQGHGRRFSHRQRRLRSQCCHRGCAAERRCTLRGTAR